MAQYPYESKSGKVVYREHPMSEAPEIGHTIKVNGESFRRVYAVTRSPKVSREIHSHSVDDDHPLVKQYDENSAAVFKGEKELREFVRRDAELYGRPRFVVNA